jgi:hypothetical protein
MFAVVLVEVRGTLELEAAAIGSILGLAEYDVKSRVLGGLPRVVLQSLSSKEAERVSLALEVRGHSVIQCDAAEVVASEDMVKVRRFTFDETGLWAHDRAGDQLAFADLGAVVVAAVRTPVLRVTQELVREGENQVVVEHAANESALTKAAYLFPRTRAETHRPWLLEEQTAQYLALGTKMQSTRQSNFLTTLDLLRSRARHAIFDDRLVTRPRTLNHLVRVRDGDTATALSGDVDIDITAYALARWLMRGTGGGGPYRG